MNRYQPSFSPRTDDSATIGEDSETMRGKMKSLSTPRTDDDEVVEFRPNDKSLHELEPHEITLSELWKRYQRQLTQNPLLTKCSTAAVCGMISEVLCMKITKRSVTIKGLVQQFGLGFLFRAPVLHFWLKYGLDRIFKHADPSKFSTLVKRVLVQELFYNPFFVFSYMSLLGLLEGLTPSQVLKKNLKNISGT